MQTVVVNIIYTKCQLACPRTHRGDLVLSEIQFTGIWRSAIFRILIYTDVLHSLRKKCSHKNSGNFVCHIFKGALILEILGKLGRGSWLLIWTHFFLHLTDDCQSGTSSISPPRSLSEMRVLGPHRDKLSQKPWTSAQRAAFSRPPGDGCTLSVRTIDLEETKAVRVILCSWKGSEYTGESWLLI